MNEFKKTLGPWQGIAMTITTFVGTGLMVLPAMSVTEAGNFAFYSWLITVLIIIPIAIVFALLGSRFPSSGGASHYIGQAFGETAEKAVGWLFLSILLVGPSVAIKVCAYYLAIVLNLSGEWVLTLSVVTIIGLLLFGIIGIQTSAKIQTMIAVVMVMAVILLAFQGNIMASTETIHTPLSIPEWQQALSAVSVVFWCFLGIEVMAHMGAEFKNPAKDFPIAMLGGITVVVLTYLTLVLLISWHHTYGSEMQDSQSIALLVEKLMGLTASKWFSAGAFLISFANTAIYILGFGRMVQALSNKKAMPSYFKTLNKYGSPGRGIVLVCAVCLLSTVATEILNLELSWLIEMTNGTFLIIYLLATIASWKLFNGKLKLLSCLSLSACLVIAYQIGLGMLFAAVALTVAYLWEHFQSTKLISASINSEV
ncbi:L-methionine/branched-chain amino acid transporter [Marinomonas sp. 15G1-11]|uniref:L-methionine/branched-chain amino acid transporter n=2 Tax=Marinomonas phaeophyticola TaxID=3004091 RepID=A0ABT4JS80_9GAMM|nr:L-methionine/branched-chain amino acid transporter [Marinomonas sp. 15G1-11]